MCGTCGCEASDSRRVVVETSLLAHNDAHARGLRERLGARGIEAVGLLGGPGAGKTTLLEKTFERLGSAASSQAVVEGDCATELDAERIRARGVRVEQVTTGTVCHLDAPMVEGALARLDLEGVSRLWIENVGNLVCPAPFSCGEARRALLVSTPEGVDKAEKYPASVAAVDCVVVSKMDLAPHVAFDLERFEAAVDRLRPGLPVIPLSAWTGVGLDAWFDWLEGDPACV